MGGQQFCSGGLLLDTRPLERVLAFDRERGTIELEAGIQWPALLAYLGEAQDDSETAWGIRQKQTERDRLSLGGALAANVHGRGLAYEADRRGRGVRSRSWTATARSASAAVTRTQTCFGSRSAATACSESSTP